MYYYVYKITNTVNGKFYIGKRRHKDPYNDPYMGSGKQIQAAIKKYGKDKFIKEIIQVFNTNEEAANLEQSLVTKEVIETKECYNMHEGGHGGFMHINNAPPHDRINVIAFRNKVRSGELKVGGTQHWSDESFVKVANQLRLNNEMGLTSGWHHDEEFKQEQSKRMTGEGNSQYGKRSYTNVVTKEKKKFHEEDVPEGWILTVAIEEERMKKSKRWYNDGIRNYYLVLPNPLIDELNLVKGRIR